MYIDNFGVAYESRECKILKTATKEGLIHYQIPASVEQVVDGDNEGSGSFAPVKITLKSITFGQESNITNLGVYCFSGLDIVSIDFSTCNKLLTLSYSCLRKCRKLQQIVFPPNLETINSGALMYLDSIETMNFPPSLLRFSGYNSIHLYAISDCRKLVNISWGESPKLQSIGAVSFRYCGLTSLYLPASLVTIEMNCFSGCPISSIVINESNTRFSTDGKCIIMKSNKNFVMLGCGVTGEYNVPDGTPSLNSGSFVRSSITRVNFPSSLTSVGSECFYLSKLEELYLPPTISSISNSAFDGCANLRKVELNASITTLAQSFFANCIALERLVIPSKVNFIESSVFNGCSSLVYVFVPKSVSQIASGAFSYVNRSIVVEFEEGCPIKYENGFILSPSRSILIAYIGGSEVLDVVIKKNIETIGKEAFSNTIVQSLRFENESLLTTIEDSAFAGGTMESISFPDLLVSIGGSSFKNCEKLTDIKFGSNLEFIGSSAFYCCKKIKSIGLPSSLLHIYSFAFAGCHSLAYVDFIGTSQLKTIGDEAFSEVNVKEMSIPASVETLGSDIFSNSALQSLTFMHPIYGPNQKYLRFQNNSALNTRNPPSETSEITNGKKQNDVSSWIIPKKSFRFCGNLSVITFGGVSGIGDYSFEKCISLEILNIGRKVSSIGMMAFKDCTKLRTISLRDSQSLKEIGGLVFSGCTSLSKFDIEGNSYFETLFDGSALLTSDLQKLILFLPGSSIANIQLSELTKRIDDYAFYGASKIKSVIIKNNSVESIGFNVFGFCTSLSFINIPSSVREIGNLIFEGCSSLKCGSINFDNDPHTKRLLVNAGVNDESLQQCPTFYFTVHERLGSEISSGALLQVLCCEDLDHLKDVSKT